jgi:hypothetical protein
MTEMANIPILSNRRRSVNWRYDRNRRRLYVSGSDFWLDITSIKSIINKHLKPENVDVIIYGGNIILPLSFLK